MKKKGLLIFLMGMVCTYMIATTPAYLTTPQNQVSFSTNQTFRWVSNEALKSHELKIYNCNYDAGNHTQSLRLDEFKLFLTKDIGINLDVAGLASSSESGNPLVVCSSDINQLNAHGLSMTWITFNWLAGFPFLDYGGITHLSNSNYVLAEADKNYIYYLPYVPKSETFIGYANSPEYKLNLGSGNGIQGITYNPINNKIYVAQEKSPITLHEFSAFSAPNFNGNISLKVPFDMAKAAANWGITSVNGLYHLAQDVGLNGTNTAEHLLVLSAESNVVIECDMNGNEIGRLSLGNGGANGTISSALYEASGISYYNGSLYIATKSDIDKGIKAKMYLFQNKNHKKPTANLGSSIFSKKGISGNSYNGVSNSLFSNNKTYCWEIIGTDTENKTVKSTTFSFKIGTPIAGCTNSNACNYNANATQDDGSCEYSSCAPVIKSISSPSAGQQYYPGSTINIKWEDNFSENVSIQLQSVNDSRTVSYSTASDGSYSYKIPNDIKPATNYRIVIQKSGDANVKRFSGYFTIQDALFINIYSPTNQSKYEAGDNVYVRWEHNVTGTFNVSLYKGNSLKGNLVSGTSKTEYIYKLPTNIEPGSDYRFLVKSNNTNVTAYSSNVTFDAIVVQTIPNVKVTAPNQNSKFDLGQSVTIRWEDNFTEAVDIFLFKGTKFVQDIAKNVYGNSLQYKFVNLDEANNYNIYIRSTKNANVSDYGPYFTLLETDIKVSSPYAGNIYEAGDFISVKWEDASSTNVSIKLYENNSLIYTAIENTSNSGSYAFRAPGKKSSSNYKIVVTSLNDNSKIGVSNLFTIVPKNGISNINLFNGSLGSNQQYINQDKFLMSWNDGVSGEVVINLFKDNNWISSLTGNTKSDGIENISLPSKKLPIGGNYQIKILSVNDYRVYNFSNSFSIVNNNGNRIIQIENGNEIGLLNVYPNPTKGLISIEVPELFEGSNEMQLSIFNVLGDAILKSSYTYNNSTQLDINLTNQPKGLYILNLRNSTVNYKAKVLLD